MKAVTLYRYQTDTGITVSLSEPDCDCSTMTRLIADKGMVLSDDELETWCSCVDIDNVKVSRWQEYPDPTSEGIATDADYQAALEALGVVFDA